MSAYDPCASTQCHGRECLAHSLAKPGHTSTRQRWELPPLQLRRCAHNQRETCQRDSTTGLSLVDPDVCVSPQLRFDVGVHHGHAGWSSDNEKSNRNAKRFLVQPQRLWMASRAPCCPSARKAGIKGLLCLLSSIVLQHVMGFSALFFSNALRGSAMELQDEGKYCIAPKRIARSRHHRCPGDEIESSITVDGHDGFNIHGLRER